MHKRQWIVSEKPMFSWSLLRRRTTNRPALTKTARASTGLPDGKVVHGTTRWQVVNEWMNLVSSSRDEVNWKYGTHDVRCWDFKRWTTWSDQKLSVMFLTRRVRRGKEMSWKCSVGDACLSMVHWEPHRLKNMENIVTADGRERSNS